MRISVLVFVLFLASCKTTSFYVVRHGEKQAASGNMMTTDVPLSAEGEQRALALRDLLKDKGVRTIYATATHRTTGTARPLSTATGVAIQIYDHRDSRFMQQLKQHRGAPVLVVGHSNTVDDIVNGLTGKQVLADLPDHQYGDLFIVKMRGNKAVFEKARFGK